MTLRQRAEETHERILDAAATGFAEHGYDTTSVAEICHRAEVSKGAFYHHFSSKQDLFLELLERWLSGLDENLAQIRDEDMPVSQELLGMTDMICHVFQAANDQLPIFLDFWAKAAHDPAIWEATIKPYRRYRAFFADMVRRGIEQGNLRPVDPDTTARVIVSFAVGLVLQGLLDAEGADWGDVAEQAVHQLLTGIEAKSATMTTHGSAS